jgi:hypothetical protein
MGSLQSRYLNKELKSYYLKDFQENVLTFNGSQAISTKIIGVCNAINRSKVIQTLYSMYCELQPGKNSFCYTSYLDLAFFEEVKENLESTGNYFVQRFGSEFELILFCPKFPNPNYNPDSPTKMGCYIKEDYFNIFHFRFILRTLRRNGKHDSFWKDQIWKEILH